ncbi:MAG: phosphatase PAP2 family protein [Chlamydiia bacterium]|nr:phosphatase PAP2 family protein [Chlamydiia bacterium]
MEFLFKHKRWLWPLIALVIIAPMTPWIDLKIEDFFYNRGNDPNTHFMTSPLIKLMYEKVVKIPTILAFLCLPLILFKKFRKPAQVIVLTMIVGNGLITEFILKDYWGRPRPKQIERYGGSQQYRPFWLPNFHPPEPSRGFVSSHVAAGFLFLTGVVLTQRYRSRTLFWASVLLSLIFGVGLSLTRMAQGGHFFSDCLVAGLIMWWTALMMNWLVYADEDLN